MQEPLRLVVDITGGAIHGTYAGLPVEIIFVSSDSDDIKCADHVVADEEDKDTAVWLHLTDGDQTIVDHLFMQMATFLPSSN